MNRFYALGAQRALEKLGFRAIGRLHPAAIETVETLLKQLPTKAKTLKKIPPEELAKKKFLAGSMGPW